MGALRSIDGDRTVLLRNRHRVGRSPDNDLCLPEPHMSGCHAELRWNRTTLRWTLCDLHSKNGTVLDEVLVPPGAQSDLREGAVIHFGAGGETWVLDSAEPPLPFAMCEQDGRSVQSSEGVLELPAHTVAEVAIYRAQHGVWVAEQASGTAPIHDRDVVVVQGQRWRVHLPSSLAATATHEAADWSLDALTLEVRVSLDEEDIDLRLHQRAETLELPHRSHHALVLVLCRERLADANKQMPARAHGWMDRDLLLEALRVSPTTLDQYVHRARKQFKDANIGGSRGIIERRRGSGSLRIGVCTLVISPL